MKNAIKKSLFAVVLAAGFSSAAFAGENSSLSYKFVEGGALRADVDGADVEYGAAIRGGWAFTDMWHIQGEVNHYSLDNGDITTARVAAGLNTAVSDRTDLVLRAGYEHIRFNGDHGWQDTSENGGTVEIGLRSALTEHFEASLGARHSFAGEGYNTVLVGAQYKFSNGWAVTTDVELHDDANQVFLGARKSF